MKRVADEEGYDPGIIVLIDGRQTFNPPASIGGLIRQTIKPIERSDHRDRYTIAHIEDRFIHPTRQPPTDDD